MIILVLALILLGSFTAATMFLLKGASWGTVILAYMAGGWAGLLLGLLLLLLISRASGWKDKDMRLNLHEGSQQI